MTIGIRLVAEEQTELVDAAVALGDRNTKTLGLLTPPAYRNAAEQQGLLVAVDGDTVVGYALFGLPKRRPYVRLAHLCVDGSRRGQGIARLLVETIRARHADRLGIKVKCRRDYELSSMWSSLGFVPRGEVRGRGRDGATLDGWWLDHDHPDLFAEVDSGALLTVVVDHGVFADLRGRQVGDAGESHTLDAAWLTDLVELAVTPQLFHDVRAVADTEERHHQRAALHGLRQLSPNAQEATRRADALLAALREVGRVWPHDRELVPRVQYVAETSSAGLQVLATLDPLLARMADVAWETAGVRVVSPSVVALHVDELRHAQAYRPADLMGTELRTGTVAPGGEPELVAFFDQADSDRGSAFEERLRSLAGDATVWQRELVRDAEGHPLALYVWASQGNTLTVPVLRTASHVLEETLTRQVLFLVKRLARQHRTRVVRITDPHMSAAARAAAADDGFFEHDGTLAALVVDVSGSAESVGAAADAAARELARTVRPLGPGLPATVASALERAWWPAKATDSHLPSFLVPIEPRWSTTLFNVPATLLPRGDELGISREHVYYRSPGHRNERVPARLLWYVSEGLPGQEGQMVIGCSRLDEVVIDTPDALFDQFEHLGVYGRREVQEAADERTGRAMALRFSDTEVFPAPVTLRRLRSLSGSLGVPLPLVSLSEISNTLFQAVYEEGHRRT